MTEPLTPADLDLRDFPYMPLDVVRLRDSDMAVVSSGEEFRAAVLLWCAAWHQVPAASLPSDERLLANLAGYGRDVKGWKAISDAALRGFVPCDDGRLYHPVIAEKAIEAKEAKDKQRARTQAAAEARRGGAKPGSPPPARSSRKRDGARDGARDEKRDDHRDEQPSRDRDGFRSDDRDTGRRVDRDDHRNDVQGKGREGKERESQSAAPEGCARGPADAGPALDIRREICAVIAPALPPGDMGRVDMWLAQGYAPALIRAVVVERMREGRRPKSLGYFDKPLQEAAATHVPAPAAAPGAGEERVDLGGGMSWPLSQVERAVANWRRDASSWPAVLGSKPGNPGCRVPPRFYTQVA